MRVACQLKLYEIGVENGCTLPVLIREAKKLEDLRAREHAKHPALREGATTD